MNLPKNTLLFISHSFWSIALFDYVASDSNNNGYGT
jgi:hypothetical protein